MATVHVPHPIRNHPSAARTVLDLFWVLSVGAIAAYAFFAALGAFSVTEVGGVSIAAGILAALCLLRLWLQQRHGHRDVAAQAAHARERRGF